MKMQTVIIAGALTVLFVAPPIAIACDPETEADAALSPPPCTRLMRSNLRMAESRMVRYRAAAEAGDDYAHNRLKEVKIEVRMLREICR